MQKILFLICVTTLFFSAGCAVHAQKGPDEQNRKSVLIVTNVSGTTAQWERELAHTLCMLLEKKGVAARVSAGADAVGRGLYGNPEFILELSMESRMVGPENLHCRITRAGVGSLVWKTTLDLHEGNTVLMNPATAGMRARQLFRRMRMHGALRAMKRG